MIRYLYLALEEKLLAITDEQETPQPLFKHCDLWNRQVEFLEQETPFETPAVFVEFTNTEWRTLGQHVQDADLSDSGLDFRPYVGMRLTILLDEFGIVRELQGLAVAFHG